MKTIAIQNKDYGWFSREPITITKIERHDEDDIEIIWCNHAGAFNEEVHNEIPSPHGGYDIEWTDHVLVCDKCPAWKFTDRDDDFWYDAPFEGIS